MCSVRMLDAAGAIAMPPSAAHSGCWASTGPSLPRCPGPAASQAKQLRVELQMLVVTIQEGMLAANSVHNLHGMIDAEPVTSHSLAGITERWQVASVAMTRC
jgi:hypothetical protein